MQAQKRTELDSDEADSELEWLKEEEVFVLLFGRYPEKDTTESRATIPAYAEPGLAAQPENEEATADLTTRTISTQTDETGKAEGPLRGLQGIPCSRHLRPASPQDF